MHGAVFHIFEMPSPKTISHFFATAQKNAAMTSQWLGNFLGTSGYPKASRLAQKWSPSSVIPWLRNFVPCSVYIYIYIYAPWTPWLLQLPLSGSLRGSCANDASLDWKYIMHVQSAGMSLHAALTCNYKCEKRPYTCTLVPGCIWPCTVQVAVEYGCPCSVRVCVEENISYSKIHVFTCI